MTTIREILAQLMDCDDDAPEPHDPAYCTAQDMHIHRCDKCKTTWEHPRNGGPQCKTTDDHKRAHTCPAPGCGSEQYYKARLSSVKSIDYPWVASC